MRFYYTLLSLLLSTSLLAQPVTTFIVSPTGSDRNPGTLAKPFATPERARDAIRQARSRQPHQPFVVQLRGGTYYRKATFTLTEADSNTVYQAYPGEKAVWHGGHTLSGSLFSRITDLAILQRLLPEANGKVYVVDLRKAGITDLGTLVQRGFGTPTGPAPMEVFLNGQPLHLARYPNPGEGILPIGRVYDKGSTPRYGDFSGRGARFGYEYDRANRWQQAEEIWLHGKFSFGYADDHLKVEQLDTGQKSLKMATPHLYGVFSTLYPDTTRWEEREGTAVRGYYAYNLLEELDQPGEYYIDRPKGLMYLFSEQPLTAARVEVSMLEDPLVRITRTNQVRLEGIDFTCSRGMGIYQESTRKITVDRCRFYNLGTVGISLGQLFQDTKMKFRLDGSPEPEMEQNTDFGEATIRNCTFYDLGAGGVFLSGGNRKTLQPANNRVVNCEFYRIDRIRETYSGGVSLRGVGTTVRNCSFHDIKHLALTFTGNNHLIEYNHFDRVCTDADDMGAIYTGRNPSARGTAIQYNLFTNIEPAHRETKMCGVYVDDGSGGITVRNNLFYKTGSRGKSQVFGAVFFHGGFDNKVIDNLFLHCDVGVGHSAWTRKRFNDWLRSPLLKERLEGEVNITGDVYAKAYPELKNVTDPQAVRLNYLNGNVCIGSDFVVQGEFKVYRNSTIFTESPPTPSDLDYKHIQQKAPNLKPFPLEKVGIQKP